MKIKTNEICLYGILGTLMFALKFVMAPLPNIEPVSLLLITYTIVFGFNAIYPLVIYVLLEILIYGFSFWSIGYFYIWPLLFLIVLATRNIDMESNLKKLFYAFISGLFGSTFGALYTPLYLITGGTTLAITWWISGLPYDVVHGIANFILCLILFKPIIDTLSRLKTTYFS